MKKVFTPDGTFLGRALKIETTGSGVEITMPGDFPGMVERIITYPGGSIVYEDENLLIVNKAKGLLAHRDQKVGQDNLMDRILHYLYIHKEYDPRMEKQFCPGFVSSH